MSQTFSRIGIIVKPKGDGILQILQQTIEFLHKRGLQIYVDETSGTQTSIDAKSLPLEQIGQQSNLIIVIGGDGSLLKAARAVVNDQVPVVGVNGGNLGFLADVRPQDLQHHLSAILDGKYYEEKRTMLNATLMRGKEVIHKSLALNDVVLHHGDIARLIEFHVFIDDQFVVAQRADGIITSTPTGSTAYSLSGGGPVVYPTLDVLTLVPMFPHALNTRPIVIDKNSKIKLVIAARNNTEARVSFDGQMHISVMAGDEVHIEANKNSLRLLHPTTYNYFAMLREKLGWNFNPKE